MAQLLIQFKGEIENEIIISTESISFYKHYKRQKKKNNVISDYCLMYIIKIIMSGTLLNLSICKSKLIKLTKLDTNRKLPNTY